MRRPLPIQNGEVRAMIGEVVLEESAIQRRVRELAAQIRADYEGRRLLLVAVLKGASIFASDLVRHLPATARADFLAISRYERPPRTLEVEVIKDVEEPVEGRHVLLVEDIVDTGFTLHYLVGHLESKRPASVRICSLMDRPALRLANLPLAYTGFEVHREFLIGYGLDYREYFRDLPFVATMKLGHALPPTSELSMAGRGLRGMVRS